MRLPTRDIIAADPVFQLNSMLWSLIPSKGGQYSPVLRGHGYFLHSIGRRLEMTRHRVPGLAELVGDGVPSPDLLVDHDTDPMMLIVECKASSFSPTSTTANQAMKLLVGGVDLADAIGTGSAREAYVAYATGTGHADQLAQTLAELSGRLSTSGLPAARAGIIVIDIRDDGVWLSMGNGDTPPVPLKTALNEAVRVVEIDEGDAPFPLYIIPWDPGVEQDPLLDAFGKALLAARVLNETLVRVARASLPETVVLIASDLLDAATFGVSASWRARHDVEKVESLIVGRLMKWLQPVSGEELLRETSPHAVRLTLKSEELRGAIVAALERVDEWEALKGPEQPELGFE